MKQVHIIETLKKLREEHGYTQDYVGHCICTQRQTYQNYESGKRSPSFETIVTLAELYHVTTDYIIRGVPPLQSHTSVLSEKEQTLIRDFSSLSPDSQEEIFHYIQFQKSMNKTSFI